MKYERPTMEIKESEEQDIITLSGEQGGDGPVVNPTSLLDDGAFN